MQVQQWRRRMHKKNRWSIARTSWLILVVLAVVFVWMLLKFPITPFVWRAAVCAVLAVIVVLLGWLSFRRKRRLHSRRPVVTFFNCLLAVILAVGSWMLPHTEKSVNEVFADVGETSVTQVNFYALTTDYKTSHLDVFSGRVMSSNNLQSYASGTFITQSSVDQDNQSKAMDWLNNNLDTQVKTDEQDTIWNAVADLCAGKGDVLVLNASYADTVAETDTYSTFLDDTVVLYSLKIEVPKQTSTPDVSEEASTSHSFGIYIAGSDSRDDALSTYTRTDVNILAEIDPVNKQIMLVSVPRDLYIPNPALNYGYDKLTHLGNSGIENTIAGMNSVMQMSIANYVVVNFATYQKIIDTLGGVDINNPYAFSTGSYTYPEGVIHLSGDQALAYVRERYSLENGDFGRNDHQIIVLRAILTKILSAEMIVRFNDILSSLQDTFATNISSSAIYDLVNQQISSLAGWNIINYHLDAAGDTAETASMPGTLLYVNHPYQNQIDFIKAEYDKIRTGNIITQQDMPPGE